jgi:putative spermidine/putrescine transport system ATP-binding protein
MLQQRLGITTVLVTHDQREAMTMSDLIVVMGTDNQVHQMGTPLEIYRHPADTFVADFIGTSNLLKGICGGGRQVAVCGTTLNVEVLPAGVADGKEVSISVRPEDISVVAGTREGENHLQGKVAFVRDVGSSVEIYLDCNGFQLISQSTPKSRPAVQQGDTATAVLPPSACVVLSA